MKTRSSTESRFERALAMVDSSVARVYHGKPKVQRDKDGKIISSPSTVKPTIFETEHTLSASLEKPIS